MLSSTIFAQTQSLEIMGDTRTYIVHIPEGVENPPLVFNIHGQGATAQNQRDWTSMNEIADREKFIVVYPNAIDKSWDYFGQHEFAFILAIIETIDAEYNIDRNRIYSMGFSQGGVISFHLACRYANVFAAIAPTSQYIWDESCQPERPMPMRLAFGTDDFTGTDKFMESVGRWLEIDSCPTTPEVTSPYPPDNPNSLVTRLYYGPCAQGTEVVVDSIETGEHRWQMDEEKMINNSEESWAFLKRFSLEDTSAVSNITIPLKPNALSAFYYSGTLHLHGVPEKCFVRVLGTDGSLVTTVKLTQSQFSFKDQPSGVYIVMVNFKKQLTAIRVVIP